MLVARRSSVVACASWACVYVVVPRVAMWLRGVVASLRVRVATRSSSCVLEWWIYRSEVMWCTCEVRVQGKEDKIGKRQDFRNI